MFIRGGCIMSIIYTCRHCGQEIGALDQDVVDTTMLGIDKLSIGETKEMIHFKQNGDVAIQVICESCENALEDHPHYHELDFFIQ